MSNSANRALHTNLTNDALDHFVKVIFRYTYGKNPKGWGPKIRSEYTYYTPEDYYQALLTYTINNDTKWLDIGCGRDIFPGNMKLAARLAARAKEIVGVDPSDNIKDNQLLDRYYQGFTDQV